MNPRKNAPMLTPSLLEDEVPSIIVHCHLRWDFVWQRPQQIFSRLARDHAVLFLEDPVTGEGTARLDVSNPCENVLRMVPVIPGLEKMSVDEQCSIVLPLLKSALRSDPALQGKFERPVQWFYSPMTAPAYLGKLGAVAVVYDCMDELANFRFAPADITDRENLLLAKADVVFTGGYQLFQAKSRHHSNTHFYGCGVDVDHFGKARLAHTTLPPELAVLPRPVFGYFGVIDERLDYELIERLANAYPDASVAMVGPCAKIDAATLPRGSNIHWLGQRSYSDLPAVVKAFDVCLMPFALNEATQYINPTKTLEYMAAGKPIVSTAVADVVRNFTPVVGVAFSSEEFVTAAGAAAHEPDQGLILRGIACAAQSSWDSMVTRMRAKVLDAVGAGMPCESVTPGVAALLIPSAASIASASMPAFAASAGLNAKTLTEQRPQSEA